MPTANLYRSQHPFSTPPTASTFGASIATATTVTNVGGEYASPAKVHAFVKEFAEFGPKKEHVSDPQAFISAHANEQFRANAVRPDNIRATHEKRKPQLDTRLESNESKTSSSSSPARSRNFIAENTSAALRLKAKQPVSKGVDYLSKPDYGQVPTYLHEVKEQVQGERDAAARALAAKDGITQSIAVLNAVDRDELLLKLKLRWEETMKAFQLLAHMNANSLSLGNLKRKEQLEQQLQEIERAISRIDHNVVLVKQTA